MRLSKNDREVNPSPVIARLAGNGGFTGQLKQFGLFGSFRQIINPPILSVNS